MQGRCRRTWLSRTELGCIRITERGKCIGSVHIGEATLSDHAFREISDDARVHAADSATLWPRGHSLCHHGHHGEPAGAAHAHIIHWEAGGMAHLHVPGRQTRERTVADGLGRREPCRAHERCSPMSQARDHHRNTKLRDCRPSRDAARHPRLGQGGTGQDAHGRRAVVESRCAGRGTVRGIPLGCDVLTLDFNKKLGVPMGGHGGAVGRGDSTLSGIRKSLGGGHARGGRPGSGGSTGGI